jgi:hypothetical protein
MLRSQFPQLALSAAILALQIPSASAQNLNHAAHAQHTTGSAAPSMPGQDAFGAIQEIVKILEADPKTDWSKVNIGMLHRHLVDMNEVTLKANSNEQRLSDGLLIEVTGKGRTKDAIQRMVPAHAHELAALGWTVKTETLGEGVRLTVTSNDRNEAAKIKALGFMGIMVKGAHHQPHHLMMAKGQFAH